MRKFVVVTILAAVLILFVGGFKTPKITCERCEEEYPQTQIADLDGNMYCYPCAVETLRETVEELTEELRMEKLRLQACRYTIKFWLEEVERRWKIEKEGK